MDKKKDEIIVSGESTPSLLISQALTAGADLEKLQGLLDLQLKWEANEARKAYMVSMANFKKSPPVIIKDGTVNYQPQGKARVKYNHSTLANVATTINMALGEHGLSATWRTEQPEGRGVKVTCVLTHELGHSEETSLIAAPDSSGGKNAIQQVGSTVTYLQRYTILALTGLATKEGDDDGGGGGGHGPKVDTHKEEQSRKEPPTIEESAKLYHEMYLEIGECTEAKAMAKWFADNAKRIAAGLNDDDKVRLREVYTEYSEIFKKEQKA